MNNEKQELKEGKNPVQQTKEQGFYIISMYDEGPLWIKALKLYVANKNQADEIFKRDYDKAKGSIVLNQQEWDEAYDSLFIHLNLDDEDRVRFCKNICPNCGSSNLVEHDEYFEDTYDVDYECNDCGCSFTEYYEYTCTEIYEYLQEEKEQD